MIAAFKALLDMHTPGWASMSMDRFRQALNTVPGRHRPALRIAFEVAQAPAPQAAEAPLPVATEQAQPPPRGPGVLTLTTPKDKKKVNNG